MNKTNNAHEKHIQSVFRALKILEFLSKRDIAVGLTEISKGMELSKSTTYGLVATLELYGYVEQDPITGKYSLGLKNFELGQAYVSKLDLREITLPDLRELSRHFGETAHLAILSGKEVVYIDKVDGSRSIGIQSRVGGRNPAYCTGVGKALLSGISDQKIEEMYAGERFEQYTEHTVVNLEDILEQIRQVRKLGYSSDMEEIELGLRCIAAPVKNSKGNVVAAISLSGPSNRLDDVKIMDIIQEVTERAGKISLRLGYLPS